MQSPLACIFVKSCANLRDLPAIRWKVENLGRLARTNPEKFALQAAALEAKL